MQQNRSIQDEETRKRQPGEKDDGVEASVETGATRPTTRQSDATELESSIYGASETAAIASKISKRLELDTDDEEDQQKIQRPLKRGRAANRPGSLIHQPVESVQGEEPSAQVKNILATLAEQQKTELAEKWALDKEVADQKIPVLEAQLANKEREVEEAKMQVEEWKKKYQKLKDKMQRLLGDDRVAAELLQECVEKRNFTLEDSEAQTGEP
ncbi:hypothetical protein EKO04_007294 [Ascochyta lentis]|uniref:Uncharacterized protein n=1 Tax=Ascochyta lentis TaxID=205686 RepID=A0A8H7MGU4_9PLEO|nr:hypothetical protein EKO04_007294 [Ascochyta lentis]